MAVILMKNKKAFALALSGITQLGIRVVLSFLIWIFIALRLKNAFDLGNYIVLIGIILGIGSAGISFYDFCKKACQASEIKEDDNAD